MSTEPNFSIITNIIDKLIIFFYRPEVRLQVIVIILAFLTAGFLSKSIWFWLEPRLTKVVDKAAVGRTQSIWKLLILATKVSTFPLLGIAFLTVASSIVEAQGYITGLLTRFIWVFWTILAFQLMIPLLYAASTPGIIYVFAFFFGIALGGDYMIIPLMAAELFGVRMLGRVMGVVISADVIGEALSPVLVGWLRDQYGSYTHGFSALIILAMLGVVAISLLPKRGSA